MMEYSKDEPHQFKGEDRWGQWGFFIKRKKELGMTQVPD